MDLHKLILEQLYSPTSGKDALAFAKKKLAELQRFHESTIFEIKSDPYSLRVNIIKDGAQSIDDYKDATYDAVQLFNDLAKGLKELNVSISKLSNKLGIALTMSIKE